LIHLASLLAYLEKHAEGGHQPGFFSEWRRSQNNLDFHSSITFDFGEREWFLTWICKRTIRRWSVVFVMNLLPLNLFDGLVSALIGGLIVVLGWRREQRREQDEQRRERERSRRENRMRFIVDAYLRLEAAANRKSPLSNDYKRSVESAVADIQLRGTRTQVELAQAIVIQFDLMEKADPATFDKLLKELRDDLRSQLGLEQLPPDNKPFILRFD
jgi:hypothetical protein